MKTIVLSLTTILAIGISEQTIESIPATKAALDRYEFYRHQEQNKFDREVQKLTDEFAKNMSQRRVELIETLKRIRTTEGRAERFENALMISRYIDNLEAEPDELPQLIPDVDLDIEFERPQSRRPRMTTDSLNERLKGTTWWYTGSNGERLTVQFDVDHNITASFHVHRGMWAATAPDQVSVSVWRQDRQINTLTLQPDGTLKYEGNTNLPWHPHPNNPIWRQVK